MVEMMETVSACQDPGELNPAITEAGKIAATGLPGLRVGQSSPGGWVSEFPVT